MSKQLLRKREHIHEISRRNTIEVEDLPSKRTFSKLRGQKRQSGSKTVRQTPPFRRERLENSSKLAPNLTLSKTHDTISSQQTLQIEEHNITLYNKIHNMKNGTKLVNLVQSLHNSPLPRRRLRSS